LRKKFVFVLEVHKLCIRVGWMIFVSVVLPCPPDWVEFQQSCYYFSPEILAWEQARDTCASLGAHLVVINSGAENVSGNKTKRSILS